MTVVVESQFSGLPATAFHTPGATSFHSGFFDVPGSEEIKKEAVMIVSKIFFINSLKGIAANIKKSLFLQSENQE